MRFRLMTYNIHKCVGGLDRRFDPSRVADAMAHYAPDVALLQEVGSPNDHLSGEKQADLLGERLGLRHRAYIPHTRRWNGGVYGNAIISRYPILETNHVDLTISFKKRRGALHARLRLRLASGASRTLHVYNLHLGLSGIERRLQMQRFLNSHPFAGLHARAPIVVGGDFNDVWGTLAAGILTPAGFRGGPRERTFPAFAPLRALDALYLRGDVSLLDVRCAHAAITRQASDHLPVVADVSLHRPATSE